MKKWIVIFAVLLTGCTISFATSEEEVMQPLAAALTKVSNVVEVTLRYEQLSMDISEQDLLFLATKHDRGLLVPFENYSLRVSTADKHAVVLVCTKDASRGLLEDAGCSAAMDRHLWQLQPSNRCQFTLDVKLVCAHQ
ncbi:MAG: hypothetical protein WD823_02835 [Sulfuricaulis sp.]|uniref:hypothetical protein n=1 Tax=Sulfuricaulis sp. TaxID=2003553 RepID=UPI0034A570DF